MLLTEPASGGNGAFDIEAIRQLDVEDRTEAELKHEQRMLHKKAAQARTVTQAFFQLEQQRFDVRCLWMRPLARLRGVEDRFWDDRPVKEGEEGG